MGRQPWTVVGLYRTADSVSPSVSGGAVLTSLIVFTLLYGILAVIEIGLMIKYVKIGPPSEAEALASIRRGPPRRWHDGDDDERVCRRGREADGVRLLMSELRRSGDVELGRSRTRPFDHQRPAVEQE